MTRPQDPRNHPLQDDEIDLARVLRALPAGEPPSHVDAAILAAATDAVGSETAAAPRRRRAARGLRWLPTWGIGTAAAAVLAVGVGLQLRPPLSTEVPTLPTLAEQRRELPEARERLSVDLVDREREILPMPGPPPSEDSALRQVRPVPAPPPPRPVTPTPEPAPPVQPQAFPARPEAAATGAAADVDGAYAFAPPPAAASPPSESRAPLETIEVTGSRLHNARAAQAREQERELAARQETARRTRHQSVDAMRARESATQARTDDAAPAAKAIRPASDRAKAFPPVSEDALLPAPAWFERIRDRRRQGDLAGARESLRLFVRKHPDVPIPTDLARLR